MRKQDDANFIKIERHVPFSWLVATLASLLLLLVGTIFSAGMQWSSYKALQSSMRDMKTDQKIVLQFMSDKRVEDSQQNLEIKQLDRRVTVLEARP